MSLSKGYSAVDRALHHVAFTLPGVQRTLADLETDLYRRQLEAVESRDEVFVTGVPRAGTTLVLELLYGTGEFASFTYRDMPFILSPLLWRRFSKSRQVEGQRTERAHGDGMEVSYDSPEAFEEVAWLALMGPHILREDTLAPVPREAMTPAAAEGLQTLVRKLLLAAAPEKSGRGALRYLSKNNANLSRLQVIEKLFPTARILVVFRDPLAQVASLVGQHRRFLAEHAQDAFSRRYMRWIGHFEFGQNLRPIDFDGRYGREGVPKDADSGFWLDYWTAAYRHALEKRGSRGHFVDFDDLLARPVPSLERLARIAGIRDAARLAAAATTLRQPTVRPLQADNLPPAILEAAQAVHRQLKAAAAGDDQPR
jgi:hypothetical protein